MKKKVVFLSLKQHFPDENIGELKDLILYSGICSLLPSFAYIDFYNFMIKYMLL